MKAAHRRTHAAIWIVLGPGLLLLGLWAAWSRPAALPAADDASPAAAEADR